MEKQYIVFLATNWGSANGGINSFNYELLNAISKVVLDNYQLVCITPNDSPEPYEINSNLSVIGLNKADYKTGDEYIIQALLAKYFPNPQWFIGHDVITGDLALSCKIISANSKSCIIHHMDYSKYKSLQTNTLDIYTEKIQHQNKLFANNNIDRMVAVGPKLKNSLNRKAGSIIKTSGKIHEIIPGVHKQKDKNRQKNQIENEKSLNLVLFGRIDEKTDIIKNTILGIKAFVEFIKGSDIDDPGLKIIGLGEDDEMFTKLKNEVNELGGTISLTPIPYTNNKEELLQQIENQDISMMLSVHEGFGLVGLESIENGIPLILSKNSGLHDLLKRDLEGLGLGMVKVVNISPDKEEENIKNIVNVLKEIVSDRQLSINNAYFLQSVFQFYFTWEQSAASFLKIIGIKSSILENRVNPIELFLQFLSSEGKSGVSEFTQRKRQLDNIINNINRGNESTVETLIFFGGISKNNLCSQNAKSSYIKWLNDKPNCKLFICYESGEAAKERGSDLSATKMTSDEELSAIPEERMEQKEKEVLNLKAYLEENIDKKIFEDRVYFIPLTVALNQYIVIENTQIYLTPLFHDRASETVSFALASTPLKYNHDVIDFMNYYFSVIVKQESDNNITILQNTFNEIKTKLI